MRQSVLAICAHPDDETLGCGGTLLRHRDRGDSIGWVITTRALGPKWSDHDRLRKSREIAGVAEAYNVAKRYELGFPSARLDELPAEDLIVAIHDAVADFRPDTVYVVHGGDVHTDHGAVFTATMSVLKPFHMSRLGVRRVISFETLSSTDAAPFRLGGQFVPNVFTDIGPHLDEKLRVMGLYESEVQPDPMPRGPGAIRALARHRGATVGLEYAEAGMMIRELN